MQSRAELILKLVEHESEHWDALAQTGHYGRAGSGCLDFALSTRKFLIPFRGWIDPPHCYGVIGGAIDRGQDPKESALRELKEETRYSGAVLDIIPSYVFHGNGGFRYYNFIVTIPDEFEPVKNFETEYFSWVTYEELLALEPKIKGFDEMLQYDQEKLEKLANE